MEKIKLVTPQTESISLTGINDGGIETYKNSPLLSLSKEEIQNSTDAGINKPVIVEFNDFYLKKNQLPEYEKVLDIYNSEREFWDKNLINDKKAVAFFDKAISILKREKIRCLRISDYNTSGLTGIGGISTPWTNLVINRFVSDKPSNAGGSFGIGGNSAFACSDLRMVFFNTVNSDKKSAFEGIIRLPAYIKNDKKYTGEGFFSLDDGTKDCKPIMKSISLDPTSEPRTELGMDKFIIGFDDSEAKDKLKEDLVASSINNFLYAFYTEKLVVKYGDVEVNKNTLDDLISKYNDKIDSLTKEYYETLKNPDKTLFCDVFEPEDVAIYVKLNPDYSRRAAVLRQTGMRIFDKSRINGHVGFAAVIVLAKDKVNGYFKKLENPEHTGWSDYRSVDMNEAKGYYNIFFDKLRETIDELHIDNYEKVLDADGMSEYLPFSYIVGNKNKLETLTNEVEEIKRKLKKKKKEASASSSEEEFKYEEDEFGNIIEETIRVAKRDDTYHYPPGPTPPFDPPIPIPDPDGVPVKYSESDKFTITRIIPNNNLRMSLNKNINDDNYNFKFISSENIRNGFIQIDISGEQDTIETKVTKANVDGVEAEIKGNKIFFGDVNANDKHTISFELVDKGEWSLEVKAYEGKK